MNIVKIVTELALTVAAIDFVSGLVHWAEDTFGTEKTPVYGKWIVIPNTLHHEHPNAFTKKNWWQSSWDLLIACIIILMVAWYMNFLSWHVWVFCFLGANANQLHKYTHMHRLSIPLIVRWLMDFRILQSAKDHRKHHINKKNMSYCVITPYLNILLDKVKFWRFLEKLIVPITGAPRRDDIKKLS